MKKLNRKTILILLGCGLLNFSLGSFYAWSVFVEPLQEALSVTRSQVSTVFSVGTICFTLAMLLGAPVYRNIRAAGIAAGSLLACALGIAIAARSMSLPMVFVGYGVIFSMANAFGYNLTLQLVNHELREFAGLATGIVTACYAIGSVTSAPVLVFAIGNVGVWSTLYALAGYLVFAAIVSSLLLVIAGTTMACPPLIVSTDAFSIRPKLFTILWLGFAFGAMAGLMVISHAAGIISAYGGTSAQIALGAMLVNIGNVTGRFSGGWLSQNFPVRRVLTVVMACASLALLSLFLFPSVWLALLVLMLIGFTYGSNASTYPLSVTIYYGQAQLAKVFGILMTAWGTAGLSAPWIAGVIFDGTGQYRIAILLAATSAFLGSAVSFRLPDQHQVSHPNTESVSP